MIEGIPYFGEQTQEIAEDIIKELNNSTQIKEIQYNSLYELIMLNINSRVLVIIDNKWFSWLNDIKFNYRDKECYIPYYSYELYTITDRNFRSNNKGHLILDSLNSLLSIRHSYKYHKQYITIKNGLELTLYNLDTAELFKATTHKWIEAPASTESTESTESTDEQEQILSKLYDLYIKNCYRDDDFMINKHQGGYHYINKNPKEFKNKERHYREQYGLETYTIDFKYEQDYRDVRQYKYEDVVKEFGLINTLDSYRERRLKFEVYLYTNLRVGTLSNLKFKHGFYKMGNNLKLIIKHYWLDNIDKPNKTYIK